MAFVANQPQRGSELGIDGGESRTLNATCALPAPLTRYITASAAATMATVDAPGRRKVTTPMLQLALCGPSAIAALSLACQFSDQLPCTAGIGFGQNESELVATQPGRAVGLSNRGPKHLPNQYQTSSPAA